MPAIYEPIIFMLYMSLSSHSTRGLLNLLSLFTLSPHLFIHSLSLLNSSHCLSIFLCPTTQHAVFFASELRLLCILAMFFIAHLTDLQFNNETEVINAVHAAILHLQQDGTFGENGVLLITQVIHSLYFERAMY